MVRKAPDALLEEVQIDLPGCAKRCKHNPSCKSFDFEAPKCSDAEVKHGACKMYVDSVSTAAPHSLEPAKGVQTDHYSKAKPTSLAGESFTKMAASFVYSAGLVAPASGQQHDDYSPELCAFTCLADKACKYFMAGRGARVGFCHLGYEAITGLDLEPRVRGALESVDTYSKITESDTQKACPAGYAIFKKKRVIFFRWVFFLIPLGGHAPHVRPIRALNTCGEPNETELTAAHG